MAKRFTDDLVTEILVKLPVKSLARFRCVSIHFYKLIQSDEFIRMHLNFKKEESVVVIRNKIEKDDRTSVVSLYTDTNDFQSLLGDEDISFPDFDFSHYTFLGCDGNGVVCITNRDEGFTYLGNPALREFKRIPPTPFGTPLGFSECEFGCGFGYDPNTKGYKIVRLLEFMRRIDFKSYYENPTYVSRVEIYCLKTDSWREIHDFGVPFLHGAPCFQLSFNGVGHWVQSGYGSGPDDSTSILCFNLSTEAFGYIKFPDGMDPDEKIPGLLVLHESLAVVHCSFRRPDEDQMVDIWVMKEYGIKESWVKQWLISLRIRRPLSFLKDDKLLIESSNGQMVMCLLQTNEIQQLDVFGQPDTFGAIAFTESLFSITSFFKNPN